MGKCTLHHEYEGNRHNRHPVVVVPKKTRSSSLSYATLGQFHIVCGVWSNGSNQQLLTIHKVNSPGNLKKNVNCLGIWLSGTQTLTGNVVVKSVITSASKPAKTSTRKSLNISMQIQWRYINTQISIQYSLCTWIFPKSSILKLANQPAEIGHDPNLKETTSYTLRLFLKNTPPNFHLPVFSCGSEKRGAVTCHC